MCLGQLGEDQTINGVTGAGAGSLGELRAKLGLPSIQAPPISLRCVCQWKSYIRFVLPLCFLFQSSFNPVTIASSPVNSITTPNAFQTIHERHHLYTKCLAAPPTSPMVQGRPRPPSARAVPLATSTTEFPSPSPQAAMAATMGSTL
ncbi:hypothetical protein GMDG_01294 [Pseudogymnoascus destructans 20631-21]|uniref:Uncharacterized protein n=1 Tax=Pseudogymnoascus destructans (strain ATCC MYA-4855 / 20631-21) TaxID=658429 RepID=L8FST9_PSED2|nr:hypothetical protein GMDG_01294 [Pseudogymnoascus destructans 20631-21]